MRITILIVITIILNIQGSHASISNTESSELIDNGASNDYAFDLADLTVDYQTDQGTVRIEAFKAASNDKIIERHDISKYGRLTWLSIGAPSLLIASERATNAADKFFHFNKRGFSAKIEMLSQKQREFFQNVVKRKYNISISPDQIVSLVPAKFECQIEIHDSEKNIDYLIKGKAEQLNKSPLKVEFYAPFKSNERLAFENKNLNEASNLDLNIICELSSKAKTIKTNTLIISGEKMHELGVIDEIFGPADHVFVTRQQVSALASDLNQMMSITEEYEMPESQFSESFISDFIKLVADKTFEYVDIDKALNSLSKFKIEEDVQPDIVKEDLGKLITIEKANSKEYLHHNEDFVEKSFNSLNFSGGGSFTSLINSGLKTFFQGGTIEGSNQKGTGFAAYGGKQSSSYSDKGNKTVQEKLDELNKHSENYIEWERKGDFIIPKRIKVAKLNRGFFSKKLVFNRIKRVYETASFKRRVSFNTLYTLKSFVSKQEEIVKENKMIQDLKTQIEESKAQIADFKAQIADLKAKTANSLNEVKQSSQSALNSQINQLTSTFNSFKYNQEQEISSLKQKHESISTKIEKKVVSSWNAYESEILKESEIKNLLEFGNFGNRNRLRLLYRASRDGFTPQAFHEKCDHFSNTFVVYKTSGNYVFGAFTSNNWNGWCDWKKDDRAFIFSLRRNWNTDALKMSVKSNSVAMYACSNYGPHFHDLWFKYSYSLRYVGSSVGNHFNLPRGYYYSSKDSSEYIIGKHEADDYVTVSEIEVFWVE